MGRAGIQRTHRTAEAGKWAERSGSQKDHLKDIPRLAASQPLSLPRLSSAKCPSDRTISGPSIPGLDLRLRSIAH